jgi:hypothetical protein
MDQERNKDEDNMDQEEENENNIEDFFAPPEIDSEEVFITESLNDSIETEVIL